jgi:arsenate reductase
MAEGIARSLAPESIRVSSAGTVPARVHPLALRVMEEIGLDIRDHWSKSVEEIELETVDAVVTLCAEESCPVLPSRVAREHWPLPDPAIPGWDATDGFRVVRDELQRRLRSLFSEPGT